MLFIDLHEEAQEQIRIAEHERRLREARAKRAKQDQIKANDQNGVRIVGFADPVHDALFKLAILGVRYLQKNGFPKIRFSVK
jgi:hypothetical protein